MELREPFLSALPEDLREAARARPDLQRVLEDLLRRASARWPELELEPRRFMAYLAARATGLDKIADLPAPDLYLACACADGVARAVEAVDRTYFAALERVLRGRGFSESLATEALQALHEKLFVAAPGRSPRIAQYQGRVALEGWLRVSAIRLALDLTRKAGREVELVDERAAELEQLGDDPELQYLRRLYKDEFRQAFARALEALSVRERNVLRLQLIDGLNTDKIGALHDVDARTVRRWLARAREQIAAHTRDALLERLQVNESAYDSIMRLISSQLDITLKRLL